MCCMTHRYVRYSRMAYKITASRNKTVENTRNVNIIELYFGNAYADLT